MVMWGSSSWSVDGVAVSGEAGVPFDRVCVEAAVGKDRVDGRSGAGDVRGIPIDLDGGYPGAVLRPEQPRWLVCSKTDAWTTVGLCELRGVGLGEDAVLPIDGHRPADEVLVGAVGSSMSLRESSRTSRPAPTSHSKFVNTGSMMAISFLCESSTIFPLE